MASCSAFASLIMMFVASSALILAVRYCLTVSGVSSIKAGRAYGVDLDMVVDVLRLNRQEERSEPFEGAEISADPEEVYLSEPCASLRIVHTVPDALQDGSEWRDTNTRTD